MRAIFRILILIPPGLAIWGCTKFGVGVLSSASLPTGTPAMASASGTDFWNSLNAVSYSGTCGDGLPIAVSGAATTTLACTNGTWSFTPTASTDGARTFTLTQSDSSGQSSSIQLNWTRATPTFADEFNTFQQWTVWDQWGGAPGVTMAVQANGTGAVGGLQACTVSGGILTIAVDQANPAVSGGYNYTEGLIATDTSFSQTYGYFEMRAKIPAGRGLWPAFWLRPTSGTGAAEIDIMEVADQLPTNLLTTIHTDDGTPGTYSTITTTTPDLTLDFHTYGVKWTAATITWYLDGKAVSTIVTPSDSKQPMYMIVDLWLGAAGTLAGAPDGTTTYPANMLVDYVRAYAY